MSRVYKVAGPHLGFSLKSHMGGERYEGLWIRSLAATHFEFHWLVDEQLSERKELAPHHHFHFLKSANGLKRIITQTLALKKIIQKEKIDLLRFHSVQYHTPLAVLLRLMGIRIPILFQHLHVEAPQNRYAQRVRLLNALNVHFASISTAANEELISLGINRQNTQAIQTIVLDWQPHYANCASRELAKVYDLIYVGGLITRKRVHLLLETAAIIQKKRPLKIAIVGRGDQAENLKKIAQQNNLAVDFFQDADDQKKWSLLKQAKIFFFPSEQEGFGSAPLEAALAGLWVIASAGGSLPEVLSALPNAKCLAEDQFNAEQLAKLCLERIDQPQITVPNNLIEYWTSFERFGKDHEQHLLKILAPNQG